ncbi:MAG: acyl carrier protein [Spirochaetes bacterium GWF1_41_5]|nr:MAG: acyl carrier protein [Spirochaetes bacterium GWF1_41_5]HBE02689.1 acyl carrier protein [Spirochaetia bacterium]
MTREQVIEKINNFIVEDFEVERDKLRPDANIIETLEIDSLDLVDLVVLIEKNFGFKVKNEELTAIRTLGDLYNYIHERVKDQ